MALNPSVSFPTKTAAPSAGYPYGAAQNVTTPGDGTGTPWVASLINDIFGFQQALLDAAGIVPSENPDEVGASQYLDAINDLISTAVGDYVPLDGSVAMTDTLDINAPAGDQITAGSAAIVSGPGGVGFYSGSAGSYSGGFEVNTTGVATIRFGTGTGATVRASATNVNLSHSNGTEVVRTLAETAGGLQINNTLTGAGFERVLTTSDLASIGSGYLPLDGSDPMTGKLTINAPAGDIIDAGNLVVVSGAGGVGIYQGSPGTYLAGVVLNIGATGSAVLQQGGTNARVSCASNQVSLQINGGTTVARTLAAASGGFEVNNTLTGAGFERVLTTGDQTVTFVRKTAAESRNTTATLTADAQLSAAVAANQNYNFTAFLKFTTGGGGARIGFNLPAGATIDYEVVYGTGTGEACERAVGYAETSVDVPMPQVATENPVVITGTVTTGGTAGNVVLTWAQETSDANDTTLEAGSRLRLERY